MRYRVVTYDDNGQEKIKKSTKGGKALYLLSDETGATHLADRDWMKAHQNQISNIGISGRQVYLVADRFDKATKTILNTWRQELLKGRSRLISQNYHIEQVKTRESPEYLEKQIQKCQSRLVALVDLYTDGDISLEVYRSKRDEYTSRMETLKAQLKEITANSGDTQEELIKERLIAIKQLLDDMALCNKEKSPNELINNFVDKIVVRSQTEFEWYINIDGNAEKYIAENCPKIHNEPYRDRAEKTKKLRDSSYYNIFRLHIGFDEVRAFKKRFGKFIRQNQWKDTDVVVYMR